MDAARLCRIAIPISDDEGEWVSECSITQTEGGFVCRLEVTLSFLHEFEEKLASLGATRTHDDDQNAHFSLVLDTQDQFAAVAWFREVMQNYDSSHIMFIYDVGNSEKEDDFVILENEPGSPVLTIQAGSDDHQEGYMAALERLELCTDVEPEAYGDVTVRLTPEAMQDRSASFLALATTYTQVKSRA